MSVIKHFNMQEFFLTLAEAMLPFRSPHNIKGHNCAGCRVRQGRVGTRKYGFAKFSFIAKGGQSEVDIEIDLLALEQDPKEYCDRLMHDINEVMKRVRLDQRIVVPAPRQVQNVLKAQRKPSLKLVSEALH